MFQNARLKLTAWYLLIIMTVSVSFSFVIYQVIKSELDRFERASRFRIERRIDPNIINESRHRLRIILITINGIIFVASGALGYLLAGRTLKPIADMVDEQNRFISDSSHELRTPLTSLKSAMEVSLRDKNFNEKNARTLIDESIIEVNKLQSLSDSLLQLAQYQKHTSPVALEKTSLDELITTAARKIDALAKKKQITIKHTQSHTYINANKYSFVDLLIILLDNAIKYSSPKNEISIKTKSLDGSVSIHIQDHGIGIDTKDIPRIFDRFYRADSARSKHSANGYGLGLSIAKKIVETHNGSIQVASKIGIGSTFTVKLPKLFS